MSESISLTGTVGIVFIILKLCGLIHWSCWWVLSPFWISFALTLVFLAMACVIKSIFD